MQNKLHWAITGKTAAEIVYSSADATKKHMGLTSWAQAPDGKVLKSDVTIAKNYLHIEQMKELNGIVSAYIDLAANRAKRIFQRLWNNGSSSWMVFLNYHLIQF